MLRVDFLNQKVAEEFLALPNAIKVRIKNNMTQSEITEKMQMK